LGIISKCTALNKGKRVTNKKLQTNKFVVPPKPDGNRKRAPYFKHYRAERMILSILEKNPQIIDNRRTYRTSRYLYYFLIPHLSKYLWFGPDRVRLRNVEEYFYNEILSYSFRMRRYRKPYRVQVWSFRIPTINDGQ
jgi:hypothetical protein